jgi:hypothetical protein
MPELNGTASEENIMVINKIVMSIRSMKQNEY